MKWMGRLLTSAAAVLLTTGGSVQAATPDPTAGVESAWAQTVKANTLEAYAAFAFQYPDSDHARSAVAILSDGKTTLAARNLKSEPIPGDDEFFASSPSFVQRALMVV